MPVTPTYPGIYIQEIPSAVHTITAAPTNIAVFIGYTHPLKTKPENFGAPVQIFGFTDFQRQFGGFLRSTAFARAGASQWLSGGTVTFADPASAPEQSFGDIAVAVNQFFLNGGTQAYVVGLLPSALDTLWNGGAKGPAAHMPSITTDSSSGTITVTGAELTIGGVTFAAREITDENLIMTVTVRVAPGSPPPLTADVIITYGLQPGPGIQAPPGTVTETYRRVTLVPTDPNFIENRIGTATNPVSALVTVQAGSPAVFTAGKESFPSSLPSADSGTLFTAADFEAPMEPDTKLDKLAIFNLLVIPGVTNETVLSNAEALCERKRAFLIVDPPITDSADGSPPFTRTIEATFAGTNLDKSGVAPITIPTDKNAALYFPYLLSPDPITGQSTDPLTGTVNEIPPSGTVAGIFSATDLSRGVWKAPAGFQATTKNTSGVVARGRMTDQRQGTLNPIGVNCLRDFPNIGTTVFGARTLVTLTDQQSRYVPVRRMTLFLEQTLYANLGWVVFEPNAEPLWTAIRMSITSFMLGLFRQGAFAGNTPSEAFLVQCDSQTTTQNDVNNGVVNILVGFAPLLPAEFVIIMIAQLAGQTQTS